jgi:hypothetical protein
MSNLQRQLATLHGNSQAATYASTTQEDAAGRGSSFVAQQGHSLSNPESSAKAKPSVFYEDAKAAADVPLSTIRENAVKGLQELVELMGPDDTRSVYLSSPSVSQQLFGHQTLQQERRMNTVETNETLDEMLCELLIVLGGCHDDSDSHSQRILHILEYLLRRYDIHSRPKTADKLLVTTLSQHETLLFGRILQLIDLPLVDGNTWIFARRFAAKGAPVMTRQVIAQTVATHEALLSKMLVMTQSLVKLTCTSDGMANTTPVGINRVLSFVGAVMAEGLTHQAHGIRSSSNRGQQQALTDQGYLKESTVRLLLPFLVETLEPKYLVSCVEFRSLGYVLICVMADVCVMVSAARELLATTMVKSITRVQHQDDSDDEDMDYENEQQMATVQKSRRLADCLVVLNVLMVHGQRESEDETYSGISFITNTATNEDENHTTFVLGCPLPWSTYLALCQQGGDVLAQALGIVAHDHEADDNKDTSFLLAAILKHAIAYLLHAKDGSRLGQSIFVALANHSKLQSSWLSQKELPASVTALLFKEYAYHQIKSLDTEDKNASVSLVLDNFSKCLKAIYKLDLNGCNRGIAHAFTLFTKVKERSRIQELMRHTFGDYDVSSSFLGDECGSNGATGNDSMMSITNDTSLSSDWVNLLPTRVAFEHPDVNVRLGAIQKVMVQQNDGNDSNTTRDDVEDFPTLLLQRVNEDSSPRVAATAAKAYQFLLRQAEETGMKDVESANGDDSSSSSSTNGKCRLPTAKEALLAFEKWGWMGNAHHNNTEAKSSSKKKEKNRKKKQKESKSGRSSSETMSCPTGPSYTSDHISALCVTIDLCALATENNSTSDEEFDLLLQAVTCHSKSSVLQDSLDLDVLTQGQGQLNGDQSDKIAITIHRSLIRLLENAEEDQNVSGDDGSSSEASTEVLLATSDLFSSLLRDTILSSNASARSATKQEAMIVKRFVRVTLSATVHYLETNAEQAPQSMVDMCLKVCMYLAQQQGVKHEDRNKALSIIQVDKKMLSQCFLSCINTRAFQVANQDRVAVDVIASFFSDLAQAAKSSLFDKLLPILTGPLMTQLGVAEKNVNKTRQTVVLELCTRPTTNVTVSISLLRHLTTSAEQQQGDDKNRILLFEDTMDLASLLTLCAHREAGVREQAVQLLARSYCITKSKKGKTFQDLVQKVAQLVGQTMKSNILLDGAANVASALKMLVKFNGFVQCLLQQCALVTGASTAKKNALTAFTGSFHTANSMLTMLKECGNDAVSLEDLWNFAGNSILEALLQDKTLLAGESDENTKSKQMLLTTIAAMLKGTLLVNQENTPQEVSMTVGPSSGGRGRSRSYSVCDPDKISLITPYPDSMTNMILKSLEQGLVSGGERGTVKSVLLDRVVGSSTWSTLVFPHLSKAKREQLTKTIMNYRKTFGDASAAHALTVLPLAAEDLVNLMKTFMMEDRPSADKSRSESSKLLSTTYITECISRRASMLDKSKIRHLVELLFHRFKALSVTDDREAALSAGGDESEYARFCILQALLDLSREMADGAVHLSPGKSKGKRSRSRSNSFTSSSRSRDFASLLIQVLGTSPSGGAGADGDTAMTGEDHHDVVTIPLGTGKAKYVAISLLMSLCKMDPERVGPSLLKALIKVTDLCTTENSVMNPTAVADIVGAYFAHKQASGISAADMVSAFSWHLLTGSSREVDEGGVVSDLIDQFSIPIQALSDGSDVGETISSLCSGVLAVQSYLAVRGGGNETGNDNVTDLNLVPLLVEKLLENSAKSQISTAFSLLRRVGSLVSVLSEGPAEKSATDVPDNKCFSLSFSTSALVHIARNGNTALPTESEEANLPAVATLTERRRVMLLTTHLLSLGRSALFSSDAKRMIRSNDESAGLCLVLWRELMQILSRARSQSQPTGGAMQDSAEAKFWNGAAGALQECLSLLQRLLPAPHYLASSMDVITDEDLDPSLRRKAIMLLSERGAEAEPGLSEALLFLETIPSLLDMICTDSGRCPMSVHHTALMAIESLSRTLCLSSSPGKLAGRESAILHGALDRLTSLTADSVVVLSSSTGDSFSPEGIRSMQVISGSLVCSSTLIVLLGARALPALKRMMKTIIQVLKLVSQHYTSSGASESGSSSEATVLLLESTLRALTALVEAVPQFLGTYLNDLLHFSVLSSSTLRAAAADRPSLQQHFDKLELATATNVPVRQLAPAISMNVVKAMRRSADTIIWKEVRIMLHLLTLSTRSSNKADLASVMPKSIGAIMTAATYSKEEEGRFKVLESASEALVALVMKLSESQLRPLYLRMREWKGELDKDEESGGDVEELMASSVRRYAFWSITATLATELRSLFLPCLSMVVTDIADELVSIHL